MNGGKLSLSSAALIGGDWFYHDQTKQRTTATAAWEVFLLLWQPQFQLWDFTNWVLEHGVGTQSNPHHSEWGMARTLNFEDLFSVPDIAPSKVFKKGAELICTFGDHGYQLVVENVHLNLSSVGSWAMTRNAEKKRETVMWACGSCIHWLGIQIKISHRNSQRWFSKNTQHLRNLEVMEQQWE